ncbi:MAG TPA: hypothetical protein VFI65_14460 [Streptosporangiaceae bacterium]|nr:hypothetical protein [Streptosporangiaceae bacterium]
MLVTAVLAVVSLAATAPAGATAPAPASATAKVGPDALLAGSAELSSVFCTSSTSCLAVGLRASQFNTLLNQIVSWNGKKWTAVSAPSPGGTKKNAFNQLFAVRCTSAENCWAVGRYSGATSQLTQALHWTGTTWAMVPTPSPGGTNALDFSELSDVSCTSASDCWAVGDYGNRASSGITRDLVLHWTGKKWFKVKVPDPGGTAQPGDVSSLAAVRCASPKDCWAAGTASTGGGPGAQFNMMLRWNGTKWSMFGVPSPTGLMTGAFNELNGLSCTSTKSCMAVGDYGGGSVSGSVFLNQTVRWNGKKWSLVKTPNPDGTAAGDSNVLNGVTCSATNNCWAVGNLGSTISGGAETGEILHWKGTKWSLTKSPNPGGTDGGDRTILNSVRCVTQKDCWAVGLSSTGSAPLRNLTLHWNSVKWAAS